MKPILFTICLLFSCQIFSQEYGVSMYSKIEDGQGGLPLVLDLEDWFGYAVENIGDLNNDGVTDLAVGALKDDDGGTQKGAVYILFLNPLGEVAATQKISDTEGGFTGALDTWDIFGSSLEFLGDINDDGLIELAVGAEYDGDGGLNHGAVWILSLNTDGTVASQVKISDTFGNFNAPMNDWDVFGTDVALLGDLNGDGMNDIAVSARRDKDGGSDRGAVYILFLKPDLTVDFYQKISATNGGMEGVILHEDYFGGSVANIGDLNGDGVIELAVGAYRDDDGGPNYGAVYILFMNSDGTVASYQKISNTVGNFTAEFNDQMFFGISVDLSRDINEDGLTEIIVGARGYDHDIGPNFGSFYVLNLNEDGTVANHFQYSEGYSLFLGNLTAGDSFGFSTCYVGSLTERDSFAAGAFGDSDRGQEKGSVWILQLGEILSIEAMDSPDQLIVAPNPSRKSFSLNIIDDVSKIEIYNLQGRKVMEFENVSVNKFDVSYLPVGGYVIQVINTDGRSGTFKLIKQ